MKNPQHKPHQKRWNARLPVLLGLAALAGCDMSSAEAPPPPNQIDVSHTYQPLAGQDGDPVVTNANTVLNSYSTLGVAVAPGDKTLTVKAITDLNNPMTGAPLAKGDLLLIYQAQGASIDTSDAPTYGAVTALNGAGTFEFVTVDSVTGNVISIGPNCGGARNNYPVPGKVQVVRVPQFNTLTVMAGASVVAKAWDGQSGGVIAINVLKETTIAGSIDVTAQGFRGGKTDALSDAPGGPKVATLRTSDPSLGAEKGESIAGSIDDYQTGLMGKYGRGAPANGGGGGNAHNAGGGGGGGGGDPRLWTGQGVMDSTVTGGTMAWALDQAYKDNGNKFTTSTGGGRGGYTYSRPNPGVVPDPTVDGPTAAKWGGDFRQDVGGLGGHPLDPVVGFQIFMGGGGGAGDQDNSSGGNGGNGGGVVILMSGSINVPGPSTGVITASGGDGADTNNGHNDAAGGGGGGGSIFVISNKPLSKDVQLIANGGFGGSQKRQPPIDASEADGPGGGGGGGFIAHTTTGMPMVSTKGSAGGISAAMTVAKFPANGATNGNDGRVVAAPRQPVIGGMPGYYPVCVPADIEVRVMPPPGQVAPGMNADFTVIVANKGENPALGTDITTTLPPGVDPTKVSWTCTATGPTMCPSNNGTGPLPPQADLPPGTQLSFKVTVPVPSMNPSPSLDLTVSAQPPPGFADPVPTNNTATGRAPISGGTVVVPKSDLEVTVTKTPDNPPLGTETTVTINAKNNGPDPATTPVVVFSIPPGSTVTQPPPLPGDPGPWSCVNNGGTYTCTLKMDLPPNSSAPPLVVKFKTPVTTGGNTGTPQVPVVIGSPGSTDPNPANNTAVVDVGPSKPGPTADLALKVTKTPPTAGPGTETTFTLQVTNKGPDTAQNPEVTFTLPPGSQVTQPAMGTGWACTRTADTITCLTGAIPVGDAAPITVKVIAPQPKDPNASPGAVAGVVGTPSTFDPNPLNNTDSKPIAGNPPMTGSDLAVRITVDNPNPKPGDTVTYTGVATNNGPDPVQNPEVVINLPPGAKVVQPAQGTGWTCTQTGTTVLCTRDSIPQGDAPPITVKVQYPSGTGTTPGAGPTPGVPSTTVVVNAPNNSDPNPNNNTGVIDVRPTGPRVDADLALSITKAPPTAGAGTEITYTVQASNKGPAASRNPSVTFTVPPGSTITQPAQGMGWSCLQSGFRFTCYLGSDLQVGNAPPITVKVNTPVPADPAKDPGAVSGVVSSPSTNDPDLLNNVASVGVGNKPATGSDLSIMITATPQDPQAGGEVTYTGTASNKGPDPVNNPIVVIDLPPGSEVIDGPRGDGWKCVLDVSTVLCSRDSIPQGSAPPITVKVKLPKQLPDGDRPIGRAAVSAPNNNDPYLGNNVAGSEFYRLTGGGFTCSQAGRSTSGGGSTLLFAMALLLAARRRRALLS